MFKIISASLLILMMSSCRTAPVISSMPAAPQPQLMMASAATNTSADAVRLVNGMTTVIDKQKVIQKLMHNVITLKDADLYDKQNVLRITFSQGRANSVIGFLTMYLQPSGASALQMTGNFYNNQPVSLSAQETAQILRTATNYPQGSVLDQILNGAR